MSFETFRFHPQINAGIRDLGYHTPTPIQEQVIPHALAGRDVVGIAQTGTGKTAAFVLPILQRLMRGPRGRVRAMIVTPTRELAEQIQGVIEALGKHTGIRSVTLYGGVGYQGQIQRLRRGVEIAVVCPGRLLDHLERGTLTLDYLEMLTLDEADRMFDMGFLLDVRQILRLAPVERQTMLFSATMPDTVRSLAREALRNPLTVRIGRDAPVATVTHAIYPVPEHLKTALLIELLERTSAQSVLIFTRTKHRAQHLGDTLARLGYRATSLHGDLSQNRRQAALDGFRSGRYQILTATDIAARGIDVAHITHVINYDMPQTAEAYTHRVGRAGRAARTGDAFTLVTRSDTAMVRAIERLIGEPLKRETVPGFDYNAAAPAHATDDAPIRHDAAPRCSKPPTHAMPRTRSTSRDQDIGARSVRAPRTTGTTRVERPNRREVRRRRGYASDK
ncbi:MAG: DEAD/DEAH box helicase [Roseiflexaceae bacterium]|nr:DEAD/DEAH box helicase [Roseiflexus sp.]MDW8145640.1 DEAD/DEAH box helicase [Roseiflexaceae bacterium]MDW8232884.1 DEAD/DEAH box helicase [Roseiflexaceae bacterium]